MVNIFQKGLLLVLLLLLIMACSNEHSTNPETDIQNSTLRINLPKSNIPIEVKSIWFYLTNTESEEITHVVEVNNNYSGIIEIENIPPGIWSLIVKAIDVEGNPKYTGETVLQITAANTLNLSLTLQAVSSDNGSIRIDITWNDTINLSEGWIYNASNPIVQAYPTIYDSRGVFSPFVLKEENIYKMWYASWPEETGGKTYLFYATSLDGFNWSSYSSEPILYPGDSNSWDNSKVGDAVVIIENGHYTMLYAGYSFQNGTTWKIGKAISEDGINWTKQSQPVLSGVEDTWRALINPVSLIKLNGMYLLYFTGRNASFTSYGIGLAMSQDGDDWWYYSSDPILEGIEDWEIHGILHPSVHVLEDDTMIMYYNNAYSPDYSIGRAFSNDGIHWQKDQSNPIIKSSQLLHEDLERVLYPRYLIADEKELIYFTEMNSNSPSTISLIFRPVTTD